VRRYIAQFFDEMLRACGVTRAFPNRTHRCRGRVTQPRASAPITSARGCRSPR
jgi:hypothetical protein